jgi:endonuclease/exonuclease/phosphatase family metal-dependent hydrolase
MRLILLQHALRDRHGFKFHLPVPFGGFFRKTGKNLESLIRFFREQKADVLGLVEIDAGSYRSGHRNQADLIARRLGKHPFCRSNTVICRGGAAAVDAQAGQRLHLRPLRAPGTHPFSPQGRQAPRHGTGLEDVSIFIVHLALGRRTRTAQLADLARLAHNARKPYLIAGDFNAFAGKVELRNFMTDLKLASANLSDAPTFPSRAPRWQLDFILHSPEIRVTHFEVARDVRLSDHLPLICDFEVRPVAAAIGA